MKSIIRCGKKVCISIFCAVAFVSIGACTHSGSAAGSDPEAVALIRHTLQEAEQSGLDFIPEADRRFKYQAFDLNHDGLDEYLVALYTPYFSGTGGSTAYIINPDGTVDSRFTVVRFPIHVAATSSEGWQDLIMYSGRENRDVKRRGGKYPSNPSVEAVYEEEIPDGTPALLDIWDGGAYPAFPF